MEDEVVEQLKTMFEVLEEEPPKNIEELAKYLKELDELNNKPKPSIRK